MEKEDAPERRGYLLNEYTGSREYFVLRSGVIRIRQSPQYGHDMGSVYLAYGCQVTMLQNNVIEIESTVPYSQNYRLAAMSEHEAEGWHDAIRAGIRIEKAKMQRLTKMLEDGSVLHKYNYSNSKRSRRYFWVADSGKELCWGRAKGEDTQKVSLKECIGIIYGPMTTTFQRCPTVDDPSWTCFSLLFMGRTLDLAVAGDLQVHAWFLGMQYLISRHGIGSMPMMSDAQFIQRRVQYKIMDTAHRNSLTLGRFLLERVRALASGKGLAGLGPGAVVSGGRLAAPLQAWGALAGNASGTPAVTNGTATAVTELRLGKKDRSSADTSRGKTNAEQEALERPAGWPENGQVQAQSIVHAPCFAIPRGRVPLLLLSCLFFEGWL
jgi:hypothetical protein